MSKKPTTEQKLAYIDKRIERMMIDHGVVLDLLSDINDSDDLPNNKQIYFSLLQLSSIIHRYIQTELQKVKYLRFGEAHKDEIEADYDNAVFNGEPEGGQR